MNANLTRGQKEGGRTFAGELEVDCFIRLVFVAFYKTFNITDFISEMVVNALFFIRFGTISCRKTG